ncbi:hypothetical protein HMN09_01324800 [Mycena chlorophos]|uniref:Uncharacterized protein n=1 Tax=Mycena chlorophos TaxID=658473 RepID=A0A8H6RZ25_MYCCL|nr:hypothetical protein HMN09_01324800 [Mycena chlorophos]
MIFARAIVFISAFLLANALPLSRRASTINVATCTDPSVQLVTHDCDVALLGLGPGGIAGTIEFLRVNAATTSATSGTCTVSATAVDGGTIIDISKGRLEGHGSTNGGYDNLLTACGPSPGSMVIGALVVLPLLAATAQAKNDWSVPCVTGYCSYDLPNTTSSTSSGSFKIWGSADAITDITTAAGWQILDCNSTALAQDIRLVCTDDPDDPNSNCNHLYQNVGAVNKIVRLPEDCGASAFARVSNAWTPSNQTMPASLQRRLARRGNANPVVKALSIDTNFDQVQWAHTGQVQIAIQGANVPGIDMSDIPTPSSSSTNSKRSHRGLSRNHAAEARGLFGKIGNAIGNGIGDLTSAAVAAATAAASAVDNAAGDVASVATAGAGDVKSVATEAATAVASVATDAATDVKSVATKAATAVKQAASAVESVVGKNINIGKTIDLPPLTFDKNINLINSQISCLDASLSLTANMDANANMQAALTVAAHGTVVPPKFTDFSVLAVMNGQISGTLDLNADVTGQLDTGAIPIVNLGIPGLDFPGILTVGPSFQVTAELGGVVDVEMDMNIGVNMDLTNATLAFPPDSATAPDGSSFSLGDTPLTLNAAPDVTATGQLTATLSPSLNFGITALGGKGEAEIFLAMDASAVLNMNLDGSSSITDTKNGGAASIAAASNATETDSVTASVAASNATETDSVDASVAASNATETASVTSTEAASVASNATLSSLDNAAAGDDASIAASNATEVDSVTSTAADDGSVTSTEALSVTSTEADALSNATAASLTSSDADAITVPASEADAASTDSITSSEAALLSVTSSEAASADAASDASLLDATSLGSVVSTLDVASVADAASNASVASSVAASNASVAATTSAAAAASASAKARRRIRRAASAAASVAYVPFFNNVLRTNAFSITSSTDDASVASVTNGTVGSVETVLSANDTSSVSVASNTSVSVTQNGVVTTPFTSGGCVNVAANLNVNVGADGSFFGLFTDSASKTLFQKNFPIFNKCFGDQANSTTADNSTASETGSVVSGDASVAASTTSGETVTSGTGSTSSAAVTRRELRGFIKRRPRFLRQGTVKRSLTRRLDLSCPIGSNGQTASSSTKESITTGTVASDEVNSKAKSKKLI